MPTHKPLNAEDLQNHRHFYVEQKGNATSLFPRIGTLLFNILSALIGDFVFLHKAPNCLMTFLVQRGQKNISHLHVFSIKREIMLSYLQIRIL